MNRKLLFTLAMILSAVLLISSVSAIWPFDGGSDVTVNGINFHLPDGFNHVEKEQLNSNSNSYYEAYTYDNENNHEFIKICVVDFDGDETSLYNSLIKQGFTQKTINGKEGYGRIYSGGPRYGYGYVENDKYVILDIPFVYADEGLQHDELLAEIIK